MKLEIKDAGGFIVGVWVARTKRGFNKKQLKQQEQVRDIIRRSFNGIVSLARKQEIRAAIESGKTRF